LTKDYDSELFIGIFMALFLAYLISGMVYALVTLQGRVAPVDPVEYPFESLR
jgi:hypothetical protein